MNYAIYLIHLVMLMINWIIIDQAQWLPIYGINVVETNRLQDTSAGRAAQGHEE